MKKLTFLFVIMSITYSFYAQEATWHLLPFVPSQTLRDIHCVNKDTAVAVGDNGYIVRTTNGGSYWDSIYSTTTSTLYKITFVNDTIGYVCGKNGTVLKTVNSGLTWTNIGISTSLNFLSMSFINQDTGWIVGGNIEYYPYYFFGDKGIVIKTCNGGESWYIDTNYISAISSICFLDNDTGYIAINNDTSNFLLKTIDGGLTYDIIRLNDKLYYDIRNIVFSNPKTGYCIVNLNNEGVYKTDDYGMSWYKIVELYYPILDISIIDSCNLYYSCWDNTVGSSYLSSFVGINHCTNTTFFDGLNLKFFGFDFININFGFCVGKANNTNYIYKMGIYDDIMEIKNNDIFNIKPNPCNDVTVLSRNRFYNVLSLDIIVYNSLGQRINSQIQINDNEILIDLSGEKSGFYIVSVRDKNKIIQNCKLIKL